MKRISTLVLAAAMAFGAAGAAHAETEIKVKGTYQFAFGWAFNDDFDRGGDTDPFLARQRVRTQVNFITSENLQGVLMFEIDGDRWGRPDAGADLGADDAVVEVKRAYLDWVVPSSDLSIRMGVQGLALPSATGFGNPILSADVAAIAASYAFSDMTSVTGFWARPMDQDDDTSTGMGGASQGRADEADLFGVIGTFANEGWKLSPYLVYGNIGGASTTGGTFQADYEAAAWWIGAALEVEVFDPLTFGIDAMYGSLEDKSSKGLTGTDGFLINARLDYRMDFGTPGLFVWYSTGDEEGSDNGDTMFVIEGADDAAGFTATSFGFAGANCRAVDSVVGGNNLGTWGIGAQIADMSFIEDMTHTLRIAYYAGTNEEGSTSTRKDFYFEDDRFLEINFDHKYQIYENLAAFVELGYINADFDDNDDTEDAIKAQVMFQYDF